MPAARRSSVWWFAPALLFAPAARAVGQEPAAKWSAEALASAETWAKQLEKELIAGDEAAIEKVLNPEALIEAVLVGIELGAAQADDMRDGLARGLGDAREQLAAQWFVSQPKWKRVLVVDGRPCARFRFSGEAGLSIVDLRLVQHEDSWRVVDIYNHTLGLGIADQVRQNLVLMLPELEAGALARLFGVGEAARGDHEHTRAMFAARGSGDFAAAVAEYAKLSQPMRDSALAMSLQVQCLGMLGDDDAYAAALERAVEVHPAPMFRMTMVDAHFVRQRWDAAIACVDDFLKGLEPDAAFLTLRANLEVQAGRVDTAAKTMVAALTLEPECEYALSRGLDVWLAAKDWQAVRRAIEALEKVGYDFHGILDGEIWAGFVAAPESEPWR